MRVFRDLEQREKEGRPILAGVIGCGFLGSGIIRQLVWTKGLMPAIIANRTAAKAIDALKRAGVDPHLIRFCSDLRSAERAVCEGFYVVTSDLSIPYEIKSIEAIFETTGNILVGAEAALQAIGSGKHFVAANPEVHATVGPILKYKADQAGVVYSDIDGDQPGLIQRLYEYVKGIGMEPVVAGNCKGVMKRYATPETQEAYSKANNIKPWIATAAADGTKLNLEMCVVANANGLKAPAPGMTGVQTSLGTLIDDFERMNLLGQLKIVEYTLGIPVGVFVIGFHDSLWVSTEMQYFKMGRGPYYLFFHPHVICQYAAVPAFAEMVLYRYPAIAPQGKPTTEVAAFAKRDLKHGGRLDGIGGFCLSASRSTFA